MVGQSVGARMKHSVRMTWTESRAGAEDHPLTAGGVD